MSTYLSMWTIIS